MHLPSSAEGQNEMTGFATAPEAAMATATAETRTDLVNIVKGLKGRDMLCKRLNEVSPEDVVGTR